MSDKKSMRLHTALTLANRVVELIHPHCTKVDIAGSIRRQKPTVHDIEILCIPKKETVNIDIFQQVIVPCSGFEKAIKQMTEKVVKGSTKGKYMQVILKGGATLDLFIPSTDDYYRQLAIRTGNSYYSTMVIAAGWRAKGWVGCGDAGLRRKEDCRKVRYGNQDRWQLVNQEGARPPAWPSERDFFNWIGVEWVDPQYRETKSQFEYLAR